MEISKGYSCGVVGFMEEFDITADVVTRNNARKGAIKIDLACWHPDIFKFIHSKDNTEKLKMMNISVSMTDKFMKAVKNKENWDLVFPDYSICKEVYNDEWDGNIEKWIGKGYPVKIYDTVNAYDLYREIMECAWKTGEPGVSFIDTMDSNNPNKHLGSVMGTNPCAEFASIAFNSCNLESINLLTCIDSKNKTFDFDKLKRLTALATRFLDNMITINKLPIEEIEKVTKSVRSIGLGMMGFADMLYVLDIPYGSNKALEMMEQISKTMYLTAFETSKILAEEKGVYSAWKGSEWEKKGIKLRNSNFLSIAPTGSISFIADVSGGLEPNFALVYSRKTNEGDLYYVSNKIFKERMEELGLYTDKILEKIANNHGSCKGIQEIPQHIQDVFTVSHDLTPVQHTDIVAVAQKYVDLSISKTINLLKSATIEDVMDVYMYAWEKRIKGITVYRDGSRENQTLAVKRDDTNEEIGSGNVHKELPRGVIFEVSDDLIGKKAKLTTGCGSLHVQGWFDPTSGDLMEVFFSKGSEGGCNSFMGGLSRMVSLAARGGVPIEAIVDQLNSSNTCPSYVSRRIIKKDVSKGNSCPTAIGNVLMDMQKQVWDELGELDNNEQIVIIKNNNNKNTKSNNEIKNKEICPECDNEIYLTEGCVSCPNCGWSRCN